MTAAIHVEHLSKRYRITGDGQGYRTLRETLSGLAAVPLSWLRGGRSAPSKDHDFWALDDVSLRIEAGEVVGLIGGNGAGKSTLLKILCRVTSPTGGRVTLRGRVGALLEVGTGFHPELTGRENVYLNGAILGMTRREITRKFDQIVEFAEIERFLDTPVKRYSSGMYVRLAFAVAAHLEPEILLIDEVLAVGDAAFQRKCMGKMGQVAQQGRTIVFVSHNMAAISRLCERVLWIDGGKLKESGPAEAVVTKYLASASERVGEVTFEDSHRAPGSEFIRLEAVRLRGSDGRITSVLDGRSAFSVEVQYRVLKPSNNYRIGVRLLAHDGTVVLITTDMDDHEELARAPGVYVSRCNIPGEFLNYGNYFVTIGCDFPMMRTHFSVQHALSFQMTPIGGVGSNVSDGRSGILRIRLPWDVERVDVGADSEPVMHDAGGRSR
jgi:lipopolysaccharide transport system ATP-binding protein